MDLILRIISYRSQPVPTAAPARFGEAGGGIGRAADNVLVLDDPNKLISRVHARVFVQDGAFVLEDMGSNPSVVNDRPLGKGCQVALAHGDRVLVGDYLLQAALHTAPATPVPASVDPLAGASILDVAPAQQAGTSDPLGLNLFAPSAPLSRAADDDHVSPELAALVLAPTPTPTPMPTPSSFAIPHDYDLLADFSPVPSPTSAPAPAPAPESPPAPVTQQPPAAADDAVLAALLRGLGLPHLPLQRPATEVAETVGAMLREATAGTINVLMARALTKKESRIDMTMLSVSANNPLKFFPHPDGALTQMLTGAMAGYMAPVDAVASAFDDLRAHELAVIAGMRAALGAVLHRFDPAQIEARLAVPTVMDKMLSSNRKAKMWDRLVELYGEIARDADDDLQRLYGEKFSEAYEEQVARLRQSKRAN